MTQTKTFRELRLERGLTQQATAERARVSVSTVRELDRGHRPRSGAVRHAVADALGVEVDLLWPVAQIH